MNRLTAGVALAVVFLAVSVAPGCSSGFLTGKQLPDRYAKIYHFKGRVAIDGGGAIASGSGMGELESCGVVVFGPIPDEVIINLATLAHERCPDTL